jgi:glycerol-1-phosphate dehydrogenase [NAD(P)+]
MLAGSTSTASGSEHLICYVLDMLAYAEGRMPDLHGAQVGVGTVAVASLYERLLAQDGIDEYAIASVWERGNAALERCEEFFGPIYDSVRVEFERKRVSEKAALAEARRIQEEWDGIREMVKPFVETSAKVRETLARAHAKTTYRDLGVRPEVFRDVLGLAMCGRNRYTVLDAAFSAGLLDGWVDEVIQRP